MRSLYFVVPSSGADFSLDELSEVDSLQLSLSNQLLCFSSSAQFLENLSASFKDANHTQTNSSPASDVHQMEKPI